MKVLIEMAVVLDLHLDSLWGATLVHPPPPPERAVEGVLATGVE